MLMKATCTPNKVHLMSQKDINSNRRKLREQVMKQIEQKLAATKESCERKVQ